MFSNPVTYLLLLLITVTSCKPRQHTAPVMPDIGSLGNEVGMAVVLSDMLHGLSTSSGEKYDTSKFTGAHKTLAFGAKVVVTHTITGKSVTVRINDRGPIGNGQVIAISKAAAKKLDTAKAISLPVRIHYKE